MTAPVRHIGIVGGGLLGMTLALRLREQGHRVTLIEGAAAPGGLAEPQSIGGFTWDRFYHVILLSDAHLRGLLDELGLSPSLHWAVTRTGFYTDGRLHSLSDSMEFLTFPPLSLVDKARLAATILYAAHLKNWRRLESVLATTWLERLSGTRTFRRIWQPLLESKLGDHYRIASAAFIWAIIARLYAARRSGFKREMFGYVDGGYDRVLARFREVLEEKGVEIRCGARAESVLDDGGGAEVRFANGHSVGFDHVVLTVPSGRIPALCPQLGAAERERLGRVVYLGIVCASLLTRKPLGGFYVTNITDRGLPFTGVIEMTTLVDRERFGGNTLVYLPRYLPQGDPFWQKSDGEVREEFLSALERMYSHFRRDDVLAFQVSRVREVLAVSTLRYSDDVLPPMRTSLPNISVVNSSQIANGTLNVNETVGLANAQAADLARYLEQQRAPAAMSPARA